MKKTILTLAVCALAITGTPAMANSDQGGNPPGDPGCGDMTCEAAAVMCALTGLDYFCDFVPSKQPKVPGDGGDNGDGQT